jgi:class 3 adenylate cyclase/CHASE2 domain-containing sensor protein
MKLKRGQLVPVFVASISILIGCGILLFSRFSKRTTALRNPGFLDKLENLTYDPRVRFATKFPDRHLATNLGCLFFDDNAIERVANGELEDDYDWPWPRYIHANVVKELTAQGAKAIGFDIVFPEKYRRDPQVPAGDGTKISSDQLFANQIKKAGNVVLGMNAGSPPAVPFMRSTPALASVQTVGEAVMRRDRPFIIEKFWNLKMRELGAALGVNLDFSKPDTNIHPGAITFPILRPRDDAPTNHSFLLTKTGMLKLDENGALSVDPDEPERPSTEKPFWYQRIWSLGIVLGAKDLGLDLEHPNLDDPRKIVLKGRNGIERTIPLDPNGCFYIDWNLNLARLLSMTSPTDPVYAGFVFHTLVQAAGRNGAKLSDISAPFTNRVVVIGSIAEGNNITDMGATPLDEAKTPLMIKHVNVANSILTGRFVQRCDWPLELLLISLLGILTAWVTWNTRVSVGISSLLGLIILYIGMATWLYVQQRYWLTIVAPLLGGVALPFSSLTAYRVLFEQDQKKHVKGVFSRIVSPDVVNELLGAEKLSLGGARRRMTVYFADVRGFTEFTDRAQAAAEEYVRSHKLTPVQSEAYFDSQAADTLATVNLYLSTIADMVKKHNGTLDKYIGDCVMAFWGAPVPNERHALACVLAAIDAQRGMQALNDARAAENRNREQENLKRVAAGQEPLSMLPLLSLGSGINSGTAIVGLMGSNAHILNYTVFGRDVNLASRLEGYSGRGRIIISEATLLELNRDDAALAATCVKLDSVTPKGFREPIPVYEVPWRQETTPAPAAAS